MKRPITALTCLFLVCLLPVQSMVPIEDVAKASKATATHASEAIPDGKLPATDAHEHPLPQDRKKLDEFYHPDDPSIPPKDSPSGKKSKPTKAPKLKKFLQNIRNFFKKFFKFMTTGWVVMDRPMGKTVQVPGFTGRTSEWPEMDKDITEMIPALQKFTEGDLLTQLAGHGQIYDSVWPAFSLPKPMPHPEEHDLEGHNPHAPKPDKAEQEKPKQDNLKQDHSNPHEKKPDQIAQGNPDQDHLTSEEKKLPEAFTFLARNELEMLNGKTSVYQSDVKNRIILLVKSLVVLSRKPEYSPHATHAMNTVIETMRLRKRPEDLPKIMPYLLAAHYVSNTAQEPADSALSIARRLFKTSEGGADLETHLEARLPEENLKRWLDAFRHHPDAEVQAAYKEMLDGTPSGAKRLDRILKWSAEVISPHNSDKYSAKDILFPLETLYIHSVLKPEGLGGHNPAFEKLHHARSAWQKIPVGSKAVHAAIEVTAETALKTPAKTITDSKFLEILTQHKQQYTPQETAASHQAGHDAHPEQ